MDGEPVPVNPVAVGEIPGKRRGEGVQFLDDAAAGFAFLPDVRHVLELEFQTVSGAAGGTRLLAETPVCFRVRGGDHRLRRPVLGDEVIARVERAEAVEYALLKGRLIPDPRAAHQHGSAVDIEGNAVISADCHRYRRVRRHAIGDYREFRGIAIHGDCPASQIAVPAMAARLAPCPVCLLVIVHDHFRDRGHGEIGAHRIRRIGKRGGEAVDLAGSRGQG